MKHVLDIPRTAMEVFNMLPEGSLCEVIDNALYMSPSPTTDHQDILLDIAFEIKSFNKKHNMGRIFVSPCDVYLDDEQSVVQPDIIFLGTEKSDLVRKNGIYGSPDLVIEILSTNKGYDKETKFQLYQRNGIAEYIMVDANTKEAWTYLLVDGQYQSQPSLPKGQLYIKQLSLTVSF
jgi:Uma2 family endonuclease